MAKKKMHLREQRGLAKSFTIKRRKLMSPSTEENIKMEEEEESFEAEILPSRARPNTKLIETPTQ